MLQAELEQRRAAALEVTAGLELGPELQEALQRAEDAEAETSYLRGDAEDGRWLRQVWPAHL